MMDLLFGLVEEEIEERDRAIFNHARSLIRDSYVLADALSPVKNPRIGEVIADELPEQILLDDTESIGRLVTDCVIEYVMGIAEQDLGEKSKLVH